MHDFEVRAIDAAGNTDPTPATRTFTVDTTPPVTTIDSGPSGTITTDQATFAFSGTPASDTAKIQCRIDSGPFADCSSPKTFTGLSDGPHAAAFRAEDAAGNQDPSPATRTFTIDTTVGPPVVDPPVASPCRPPRSSGTRQRSAGSASRALPKAKKGKKATYKLKSRTPATLRPHGSSSRSRARGSRPRSLSESIAGGTTKKVKVKVKPKKLGKVKVSFKVSSDNAGGKTVKKKIKVKK